MNTIHSLRRRFFYVSSALLLSACGGADTPPEPSSYIAFASSFQGFRSWKSFRSAGPPAGDFTADVLGPRTQYLNRIPPRGSTAFPVGTIIVEARENAAKTIFAGVKRGGGFNPGGAEGWEWFEIKESATGVVSLVWRGVGPPANGDVYGGDPAGGCNTCHDRYRSNDFVASPYLQLSSF